jgi:hypothetical protein
MPVADILLTPATLWYAPVGEPVPDENSVGYGDDWGGNWESVGFTLTPLTLARALETFELEVEQRTTPVKEMITKETVTLETTLAEFIEDNVLLAFGGSVVNTSAGPAQVEKWEHRAGGDPQLRTYAFGFEGLYITDANAEYPVRVFIWRGNIMLNGQLQFAKGAAAGIPIQITSKIDDSKPLGQQLIMTQKVTGPMTS